MEARMQWWWWWRRWLPYVSVALLALMLVAGIRASDLQMDYTWVDRAETHEAMAAALDKVEAAARRGGAASLRSDEMQRLLRELPYTGMVILVDADGQVVYNSRPTGFGDTQILGGLRQSLLKQLAASHLARLLASLPPGLLDPGQLLLLQTIYVVQAEGEHADLYRYGERLLRDEQGDVIGAAAVSYGRTPDTLPAVYRVTLAVSYLALGLYWLSLPAWVWLDARSRGERAWLWASLALVGNLLGVITYLLARRAGRAICPGCGAGVRTRDNACPHCGEQLRRACRSCHEALKEGWRYCPHCAANVGVKDAG